MKIAIDVSQMCYEGTGVARYVYGLTQALLKLDTDHKFLLFAGTLRQRSYFTGLMTESPWNKATWKILPLPPKLAGLVLNSFSVPIESLVGNVDILHSSDWAQPSSRCPRVTTVHDLVFKKYPGTVDKLILSTQTRRMSKVIREKTHIIADSMSTKVDLMEIYGLPDSQIDVVYPGVNPIYAPQTDTEIERVKIKYNLPPRFILSVGTQEPRKNLPRLIDACKTLDTPLVLTGKYGWGDPITPGVKGAHTPGVLALGYVDDADLPGLYSGAHVFAYPSLYEGFGFPVIEAMACSTPVVTSNISSLPEIVGEAGVLVDPMSVLSIKLGIMKADENRDKFIKLGIAQASKFTWDSTARGVLKVYEKITHRD
jgi:glycosyltransferase involved in cell wall biosynthesis